MNPTKKKIVKRRNPGIDILAVGIGLLAGAGVGGAAYALDSQEIKNNTRSLAIGAAGIVLGIGASMLHEGLGAGIAGGGTAIAVQGLLRENVAGPVKEPTADGEDTAGIVVDDRRPRRRMAQRAMRQQLGAVRAPLGAVRGRLGAAQPLGAVQATMRGVQATLRGARR